MNEKAVHLDGPGRPSFKLWKPQNHEKNKFRGPVRLRVALADSINTVSIKLLSDIGVLPVRELAVAAGLELPPPEKLDLSLALGTATVTPIEMANAYATFASGGTYGDPPSCLPGPSAAILKDPDHLMPMWDLHPRRSPWQGGKGPFHRRETE